MQALGVIGFLALIAGIIMLIVSAIRRRRLRTWGIVIVVGLVAFIVGMSLSDSTTQSPESAQSPAPEETAAPTAEPALITKDASELVLTIADFEPGWVQQKGEPTTKESAQSAYYVYFYEGKSIYPSVIQNTMAVYPSIELAEQTYLNEVPKNISLENPKIGDESFLDISISVQKRIVFRKSNVVVWLLLQQDMFGDVKPYARIIEKRLVSHLN